MYVLECHLYATVWWSQLKNASCRRTVVGQLWIQLQDHCGVSHVITARGPEDVNFVIWDFTSNQIPSAKRGDFFSLIKSCSACMCFFQCNSVPKYTWKIFPEVDSKVKKKLVCRITRQTIESNKYIWNWFNMWWLEHHISPLSVSRLRVLTDSSQVVHPLTGYWIALGPVFLHTRL